MNPNAIATIFAAALGFLIWAGSLAFVVWFVVTIVKWAWGA